MMHLFTQNRVAASRTQALGFLLAALITACLLVVAKPAHASTTFTVDRTDDPDPATAKACTDAPSDCSLRGAIVAANAASGEDAVTLLSGTYTLTREATPVDDASVADLDVTDELTITGAGARSTSVVGGPAPFNGRIFENHSVKTTITGLTITGGKPSSVEDNLYSYNGGGVYNHGDLTLEKVAVKGNNTISDYGGGGIWSKGGTLNLTDSTVSGNSAGVVGGVLQESGTATITNTTISGNKAAKYGGGVLAYDSVINVRNSTISSNKSNSLGGGILTAGAASTVLVKNTIVAGNSLVNCGDIGQFGGVIFSQGNNISSDESCPFTKTGDKQNTNPLLGLLQDNGGPTDTHALLPGSPAVDAANNAACPQRDQRGVARKDGDKNGTVTCDIGAFERNDLTPPKVNTTTPPDGKRGVKRTTGLTATVSETMDRATLSSSTFKLYKVNRDGSTTQISAVTVSTTDDGLKATLKPDGTLRANTEYKAVVTTGAKDVAGNRLDQDRKQPKNQRMEWYFTTGTS